MTCFACSQNVWCKEHEPKVGERLPPDVAAALERHIRRQQHEATWAMAINAAAYAAGNSSGNNSAAHNVRALKCPPLTPKESE